MGAAGRRFLFRVYVAGLQPLGRWGSPLLPISAGAVGLAPRSSATVVSRRSMADEVSGQSMQAIFSGGPPSQLITARITRYVAWPSGHSQIPAAHQRCAYVEASWQLAAAAVI